MAEVNRSYKGGGGPDWAKSHLQDHRKSHTKTRCQRLCLPSERGLDCIPGHGREKTSSLASHHPSDLLLVRHLIATKQEDVALGVQTCILASLLRERDALRLGVQSESVSFSSAPDRSEPRLPARPAIWVYSDGSKARR